MPTEITLRRWAYAALFFVAATLSFSISLFEISSGVFLGLTLLAWLRSPARAFSKDLLVGLCGLYFLAVLLSLTQTGYWAASLRGVFKALKHLAIFLGVIYVVDSEPKFRRIFEMMLWVSAVISVDALLQSVLGYDPIRRRSMTPYLLDKAQRLTGPFGHANNFSAYLSLMIPLYLSMLAAGRDFFGGRKYAFFWLGFLLASLCLAWTYSRGAWVAVFISVLLLIALKKDKMILLLLTAALLGGALFAPPLLKERFMSLWDPGSGTTVERKILWRESFRMISKSPWLGLGVNTYARNEPSFKSTRTDNQYAHNGFLQMAAEIGLVGLLSFLACVGYGLASSAASLLRTQRFFIRSAGLGLWAGLVAFLLHAVIDTNLQSLLLVNLFWFSFGLLWVARRLARS